MMDTMKKVRRKVKNIREQPLHMTGGISTATHSSVSAEDGSNLTDIYSR